MKKTYKTEIDENILELLKETEIEIRVADSLKDANINWLDDKANEHLALYTNGIIFVKSQSEYNYDELNLIVLHEVGHAFIQHHQMRGFNIDKKTEEISANCIAFTLANLIGIEVNDFMIGQFNKYNDLIFD
ncbi:hypothetical protein [Fluviispira vulneris]|uniref:hypothetical protein n=1 Tax=Fluviispira vulneris TaxID=2763012 RepID=UPI001644F7B6|nr:hypothetical protein [Fluviispira vulneris]